MLGRRHANAAIAIATATACTARLRTEVMSTAENPGRIDAAALLPVELEGLVEPVELLLRPPVLLGEGPALIDVFMCVLRVIGARVHACECVCICEDEHKHDGPTEKEQQDAHTHTHTQTDTQTQTRSSLSLQRQIESQLE